MASTHPTIGQKIKRLRRQQGWTLRALGTASGITYTMIGRWERRIADPSYEQTCKLAEVFRIPPSWLWDPAPMPEADTKSEAV